MLISVLLLRVSSETLDDIGMDLTYRVFGRQHDEVPKLLLRSN